MTSDNGVHDNSLPVWLTKDYLEKVFQKYKNNENLQINHCEIKPATAKGDNYASVMTRVKLSFNNIDANGDIIDCNNPIKNYIVKTAFEDNAYARDTFQEYKTCETEMNMYEHVIPKINEILHRIDTNLYIFPEVIHVDRNRNAIIMEDLTEKNYITADRTKRLDMKHTKSSIDRIALFHAVSVVLANELKNGFLESFDRGLFNRVTHAFESFFKNFFNHAGVVACQFGGEYEIYGQKIQKLVPYFMEKTESALDLNDTDFFCLNHGDIWTNNFMYKYDEHGEIENTIFVDFQYTKWTSPAWDLYYFFNTSLQEDLRYNCQDELIQYYYIELVKVFKKLNYSGKVPTLNEFYLQMSKKEFLAVATTTTTKVLLINEETDDAEFDVLMKNDERSQKFRRLAFSNKNILECLKNMLPIYNQKGLLDL